ncbi:MAG: hypothetical protein MJ078_04400, partial [Clostridia bacterium]|nr:hypothetical protein [Clostridia bacterium]
MGDKAIAKAERGVRLFSLFDGLSGDLLFWVAIDTLFLTYVKHLSPAEIVSLTAVATAAGMLFQFPGLWLIGKIGASSSVTVGTVILLFSALSLTLGPTYGFLAAGRAL